MKSQFFKGFILSLLFLLSQNSFSENIIINGDFSKGGYKWNDLPKKHRVIRKPNNRYLELQLSKDDWIKFAQNVPKLLNAKKVKLIFKIKSSKNYKIKGKNNVVISFGAEKRGYNRTYIKTVDLSSNEWIEVSLLCNIDTEIKYKDLIFKFPKGKGNISIDDIFLDIVK